MNRTQRWSSILFFPFLSFLLLQGCSNELDVNAEWKETAIVYGLLNPSESLQYVRIQKTFQNTDADVADLAQRADSLYFDTLIVNLVDVKTGTRVPGIKTRIADKDPGYFTKENYAYAFNLQPNSENQYRLELENPKTGYRASSQTGVVGTMLFQNPNAFPNYMLDIDPSRNFNISFRTAPGGKVYDLVGRFNYQEYPVNDTNAKVNKSLDYHFFRNYITSSTAGNTDAVIPVKVEDFFNFLLDNLPEDQNIRRRILNMDFIYYIGTEDLYDYMNIGRPSLGVVQKTATYSNINNGLGLFSSRNISVIPKVRFSSVTKATLSFGTKYASMRFDGK